VLVGEQQRFRSRSGGRRVGLKDSLLLQGKLRAWHVMLSIWRWRLALTE
jgi:hypothetical protein